MYTPTKCTRSRATLALLTVAAVLSSNVSRAQLKPVDQGAAAIDSNGLMWANTVGVNLGWNPNGGPGIGGVESAQEWIANLNATDYGGFNDWTLPTADYNVGPNTTTNQLGELFYSDCGNTLGQQTSLTRPRYNCRALSALIPVMKAGLVASLPGYLIISSGTYLGPSQGNPGLPSWAVFQTYNSSEGYWDGDTEVVGITGEGDVLAVRFAGVKPKDDSVPGLASRSVPEPNTFALLGMGLAGLGLRWRGNRRRPIR